MEMVKQVRGTLRDKGGQFLLGTAVKLLAAAIVVGAGVEVYHVYHVMDTVRTAASEAVLAVAATNVSEFYGGAREGDGFARHPEDGVFASYISTDDVVDQMVRMLGVTDLAADDTMTVGRSFSVRNVRAQYVNFDGTNLHFRTTLTVSVPLSMGGILLPDITSNMEVMTSYAPKF